MKPITLILAALLFSLISCDDNEIAMISIQNDTDYELTIDFYPTEDANGYKLDAVLDTVQVSQVDIYNTDDEGIDPCVLLSRGYDAIIVHINDPENNTLHFGKNTVPNYTIDPFTDSDKWVYEVFMDEFYTNFSSNTTKVHNYILVIDMENIVQAEKGPK